MDIRRVQLPRVGLYRVLDGDPPNGALVSVLRVLDGTWAVLAPNYHSMPVTWLVQATPEEVATFMTNQVGGL
jgi:hypothetical protein